MLMTMYANNRARFSLEELRKYADQWVAFSLDGSRVLASATTLTQLEDRLAAAGVDAQNVALERVEFEDSQTGGAEFL